MPNLDDILDDIQLEKEEPVKGDKIDIIPYKNIDSYIKNSNYSKNAKKQLMTFKKMIEMSNDEKIPVPRVSLVCVDPVIQKDFIKIIESIYIGKDIVQNKVFDLSHSRKYRPKKEDENSIFISRLGKHSGNIIDSSLYPNGAIIYFTDTISTSLNEILNNDGCQISFIFENSFTPKEIVAHCKNICRKFNIDLKGKESDLDANFFKGNIDIARLDSSLKNLLFAVSQQVLIRDMEMPGTWISFSAIFRAYDEPFNIIEQVKNEAEEKDKDKKKVEPKVNKDKDPFDGIIGLENVKKQVNKLAAYLKKTGDPSVSKHMAFLGNPGTGKTVMARAVANKLYQEGIVTSPNFVEVGRSDLVGEYIGQSEKKTADAFERARGGVLFIDEAYSLYSGGDDSKDYGKEVINTLIKLMEDNRDDTVIILAGYKDQMQKLISSNPGFRTRIHHQIVFEDYSKEELLQIMNTMLLKSNYILAPGALKRIEELIDQEKENEEFGNGRFIRNLLEGIEMNQAYRADEMDFVIYQEDVEEYIKEMPKKEEEKRVKMGF